MRRLARGDRLRRGRRGGARERPGARSPAADARHRDVRGPRGGPSGRDCADGDASRAPGLAETPDCRDQDCDGEIDEGLTRASTDDRYEPNDASDRAWHLGSDPLADLSLVTREKADEEWFLLTSKDHHLFDEPLRAAGSILAGSLDGWRLKVVAHQLPDDAVYDVEFWHDGAKMGSGTLSEEGQKVRMPGSILRDDSGAWHVRIVPVKAPREWCPVELRVRGD